MKYRISSAVALLFVAIIVLASGCNHARSTQERTIIDTSEVSQELVGKQITIRGKLVVGKPGAGIVLSNEDEVYIIQENPKPYSEDPYAGMYDKVVEVTGTLRFFHNTAPPTHHDRVEQEAPDHYYFEEESAQVRLVDN